MTDSSASTVRTRREAFRATAADAPAGARVPVELRRSVDDPFDAYRRARDGGSDGFLLETTGGQSGWGYFGVDPVERTRVGADAETLADGDEGRALVNAVDEALAGEDREMRVAGDGDAAETRPRDAASGGAE
jgi:anthranilate synthase component 1